MNVIRQCFTGRDNATVDIGRVLWAVGVLGFVALAAFDVVKNGHTFSLTDYGVGFGAVMASGGGALWMKAKTEPGN